MAEEELIDEKLTELIQPFRIGKKTKEILMKMARNDSRSLTGLIRHLCICKAKEKEIK